MNKTSRLASVFSSASSAALTPHYAIALSRMWLQDFAASPAGDRWRFLGIGPGVVRSRLHFAAIRKLRAVPARDSGAHTYSRFDLDQRRRHAGSTRPDRSRSFDYARRETGRHAGDRARAPTAERSALKGTLRCSSGQRDPLGGAANACKSSIIAIPSQPSDGFQIAQEEVSWQPEATEKLVLKNCAPDSSPNVPRFRQTGRVSVAY
jgi:hypothetical protein